jgi:3-oxoacyl-[acyl-carrier protein] reductase
MEKLPVPDTKPELLLVTGASSDIGMALLRGFIATSPHTHVLAHCFRGSERLEALAAEFSGRITPLQADLSSHAASEALATHILETHGVPTGVVHLPGLRLRPERFTKFDWSLFESDLAVQLGSAVALLGRLLPKMTKQPRGRVVFMLTSCVHGVPPKYLSHYTVVKYAQLGLMRALAAEYAATSVRINAVSPSMVETQFLSELNDIAIQGAAASNPLGRNAKPEDVIGAILFLLSTAADYISGVTIPIAAGTVS